VGGLGNKVLHEPKPFRTLTYGGANFDVLESDNLTLCVAFCISIAYKKS